MTASLVRAAKIPPFDALVGAAARPGPQTPAEQRVVLEQLSGRLGVPLERIPWSRPT